MHGLAILADGCLAVGIGQCVEPREPLVGHDLHDAEPGLHLAENQCVHMVLDHPMKRDDIGDDTANLAADPLV